MAMLVRDERKVAAARWWQQLKASNNAAFLPLFFDEHRFLVLKGGGGSGKSIFAGRKVLERCVSEPGHRFLVCRKVARTIRESCFAQLRGQAAEYYPDAGIRVSQLGISFGNGSEVLFAGLDDVEKLKSIYSITSIWVEEASELLEGDLNQLDIRLRGESPYYKQIILSFNPISLSHWLKARFFDRHDPRALVHESTYLDNRFLPAEDVRTLESFRDTDEYYYMVYALGQWGVTGRTVFNAKAITARLQALEGQAVRRGIFVYSLDADGIHVRDWRFVPSPDGAVAIYQEPGKGVPYVIGGDTAGDGSDYFVCQVLDNCSGRQVAVLRQQYDEDEYARQVWCLGMYYNAALVAVEVNFSIYPVKLLQLMDYPRQYEREVPDTYEGKVRRSYGFRTDRATRQPMLSELIRIMRERVDLLYDAETLREMLSFVRRDGDLRMEAEAGAHDDLVMALGIAFAARGQQRAYVLTEPDVPKAKLIDKLEKKRKR